MLREIRNLTAAVNLGLTNTNASLSTINNTLRTIDHRVSTNTQSLITLTSTVGDLSRRTEVLEANTANATVVSELRKSVGILSTQVTTLLNQEAPPGASSVDLNSLASELQARMLRANNVILYNVPEAHTSAVTDEHQITELLSLVPGLSNPRAVTFKRIVNSGGPNRPRLLQVRLHSVDDFRRALSFSRRLPHGITVTSDRTTNQRQSL